jgi:capsular exopolysaccharide synthesis family protein
MSRNFELMQQLESDAWSRGRRPSLEPLFAGSDETEDRVESGYWASDEALRLVQRIFLLQTQKTPRMVVFAGINHGDGCSRISASVAETLAKNAVGAVCLVEANFRSPALPGFFGTTNHHGLTDALQGDGPISSFATPVATDKLWLLSAGALAWDSASLLTSERLKTRFTELRSEFDFVIIDAPPLTRYADAIAIGQLTDGLVLVLEAGSTRREAAQIAATSLRASQIPILGAVLNKRTFPIPDKIYRIL